MVIVFKSSSNSIIVSEVNVVAPSFTCIIVVLSPSFGTFNDVIVVVTVSSLWLLVIEKLITSLIPSELVLVLIVSILPSTLFLIVSVSEDIIFPSESLKNVVVTLL